MPAQRFTREEEDQGFDPHAHRKIKHPTTYSDTMVHLLKGSIGAGILAMPEAVKRLGVTFSIIALIIIGFFAAYCILLLVRLLVDDAATKAHRYRWVREAWAEGAGLLDVPIYRSAGLISAQYILCKRWKRGYMAYPKSMKRAIQDGPPFLRCSAKFCYWFVDTVLILWQLGICTIYFVFVAENIKQVFGYYEIDLSLRLLLCYQLPPAIIVNLVKNLKLMTPMSTISNIVTMFGLILVFFYLIEDDLEITKEMNEMKSLLEIPLYIGTALFALEAVGVVLALEYNMENPKQFGGPFGLFTVGMVVIITLYLLVGVFGYLKYGDNVKASLTLNLPEGQKKAQAAKLIFAFAIFLSFPLQNFVAYNIIWRRLQKKVKENQHCIFDYSLRIVLVVIPWLLAVAVPKLGPFIALFGALCLSLLAMVFPGLMDVCVYYANPKGYGPCKYRLLRDIFIMAIGTCILISGVYASVLDLLDDEV